MKMVLAALALLAGLTGAAQAQESKPSTIAGALAAARDQSPANPPEAQLAAAKDLLRVTGAEAVMRAALKNQGGMIEQQLKKAMPDADPAIVSLLQNISQEETEKSIPHIMDESARIYARHFSEADLRGLIAFYATPLGAKLIEQLPAVTNECAQMSAEMSGKILVRFREELAKRNPPGKAK